MKPKPNEKDVRDMQSDTDKSKNENIFKSYAFNPWVEMVNKFIRDPDTVEKVFPVIVHEAEGFRRYLKNVCQNEDSASPEDYLSDVSERLKSEFKRLNPEQTDKAIRMTFNLMYDMILDIRRYEIETLQKMMLDKVTGDELKREQERVLFLETVTFMLYSPDRVKITKFPKTLIHVIPEYHDNRVLEGYDSLFDVKNPPYKFPWKYVGGKDVLGRKVIISDKKVINNSIIFKRWENIGELYTAPEEQFKEEYDTFFTWRAEAEMLYDEKMYEQDYEAYSIDFVSLMDIMAKMVTDGLYRGYYKTDGNSDEWYVPSVMREALKKSYKGIYAIGKQLPYLTEKEFVNTVYLGMIKFLSNEIPTLEKDIKNALGSDEIKPSDYYGAPYLRRFNNPLDKIRYRVFWGKLKKYEFYKELLTKLTDDDFDYIRDEYLNILRIVYQKSHKKIVGRKLTPMDKMPTWARKLAEYIRIINNIEEQP